MQSADAANPWRFLTALDGTSDIDRQLVQATRPDEVQLVSHMVAAARVSVLYSFSGNGKSSIVNAGLIPFLTANRYAVFRVRPRPPWSIERPTQAFKESILRDINLPLLRRSDLDLLRRVKDGLPGASLVEREQLDGLIARLEEQARLSVSSEQQGDALKADLKQYVDRPLVEFIGQVQKRLEPETTLALICDQFEELFVHFGNTPALDEFVTQIGEVWADSSLRVRILFSMREDWVGSLIEFRKAIPDIFRDYFKLKPITRSRAGHVLTLPLEAVGSSIEPKAIDAILDDLVASYDRAQRERFSGINLTPSHRDDPFIELPALQVVADRLWATRNRVTTPFTLAHYRMLGNHTASSNGSASPAQAVLDAYLGDLLEGGDDAGDLSPRELRELRLDCLYLLTDRVRHRRALPKGLLLEELNQIRAQSLNLPAVTDSRLQQALLPLQRRRLVREDVSRTGDCQYELAHDFAVRSVVATWRQLDRERTAAMAVLEQQRKQTEQKVDVLEHAERRSTRLLHWAPLAGLGAIFYALYSALFSDSLAVRPVATGLIVVPFILTLTAALLRGHRPGSILGGVALVGTAGAVFLYGFEAFSLLTVLAATLIPLYLWSGYTLTATSGSRFVRMFGTLWTEYVELLKLLPSIGAATVIDEVGWPLEAAMMIIVIMGLGLTLLSGFQIARRGYQTGHGWTGRRVTRVNGEPLSVLLGIFRQVALVGWVGAVIFIGFAVVSSVYPLSFGGIGLEGMVVWGLLSIVAWTAGAAFIGGLGKEERHVYDRISGAHVTYVSEAPHARLVPAFEMALELPKTVNRVLVPAFAIAIAGTALVAFVSFPGADFYDRLDRLSYSSGFPAYEYVPLISLAAGGVLAASAFGLFFERTRKFAARTALGTFAVAFLFAIAEIVSEYFIDGELYRYQPNVRRMFEALEAIAVTLTILALWITASERRLKRMRVARVVFAVGLIGYAVTLLLLGMTGELRGQVVQLASFATGVLLLFRFHAARACQVLTVILALDLMVGVVIALEGGNLALAWVPTRIIPVIGTALWAVLEAPRPSAAPAAAEVEPA